MTLEFNTRVDYEYLGGDTIFSVPFSYINKSHIVIVVNGDTENPLTEYEWLNENQIRIKSEINTGDKISICRQTPIDDKMVKFTNGNILDEYTQNLAQDQTFNVVQEIKDSQDDLNADMQEFVNIKDSINDQMQLITEAGEQAKVAVEFCQDTQELVNNIGTTFNELQEKVRDGVPTRVTQNLFTINIFDKKLSGDELVGLAEQGSTQSAKDYPNAYLELAKEYNEGETKLFKSDDNLSYVHSYQGNITGTFYTDITSELAQGVTVYSDIDLSNVIGTVENYQEVQADEYKGSITESIFVAKDSPLEKATNVCLDKTLINCIGAIEDVKEANANVYEAEVSGRFYISPDEPFRRGQKVYSDAVLTKEKGEITYLGTISVDRYVTNKTEGITEFYVPKDTVLASGVELFSDKSLTTSIGTISVKGIQQLDKVYYYQVYNADSKTNWGYFYAEEDLFAIARENYENNSVGKTGYYMYKNRARTERKIISSGNYKYIAIVPYYLTKNEYKNKKDIWGDLVTTNNIRHTLMNLKVKKVSTDGGTTSSYICISGDTTKLQYQKAETIEDINVISINEGNYEPYTLLDKDTNTYIKITNIDYQLLVKETSHSSLVMNLVGSEPEEVTNLGLVSASGIIFEYKEYANTHKIVDSKYKATITNLLLTNTSEFYMIDTTEETFMLPTLDLTKNIYFNVGNILLIESVIDVVTQTQLNRKLADYALMTDETVLALTEYVAESGKVLAEVKELITEAEVIASDTLEEF